MKKCNQCKKKKKTSEFYPYKKGVCKACLNKIAREYISKNKDSVYSQQSKYITGRNKDFEGRKHILYKSIKTRVRYKKSYFSRKITFSKEEFLSFLDGNKQYIECYKIWKNSGFNSLLAPTIDRIDNSKDYSIDNIQIITKSANSKKGAK